MESCDDNDNHMLSESNDEDIDDSYIRQEDKKNLLITIKKIYETNMPWADQTLTKIMVKHHYKDCIKNMYKKAYLEEINKNDIDTLLEQL